MWAKKLMFLLLSSDFIRISRAHGDSDFGALTENGYDNPSGEEAICWEGTATIPSGDKHPKLPPFFIEGLAETDDSTYFQPNALSSCPTGTFLSISPPGDFYNSAWAAWGPLTKTWYNYTVQGQIDLTEMNGLEIVSSSGNHIVRIETMVCRVSSSLCSPFVRAEPPKGPEKEGGGPVEKRVESTPIYLDLGEPTDSQIYTFNVQVPMSVNIDDLYNVIGIMKFYTGSTASMPEYRWDIANSLPKDEHGSFIHYYDAPEINEVSPGIRIFVYCCIAMSSIVLLVMIGLTIKYYSTQVMQLQQAPFLLLYQVAALQAVICTFLLEPRNDFYCNWAPFFLVIPFQLHQAITIGRCYRIHTVVSPLLSDHFNRDSGIIKAYRLRFLTLCLSCKWKESTDSKQIRQTVRPRTVVWIIACWTVPQILLQTARVIWQPDVMSHKISDDFSEGRQVCTAELLGSEEFKSSIWLYSVIFLGLEGCVLLGMASLSRSLPSLLNESYAIYSSTLAGFVSTIMFGTVLLLTKNPEADPGMRFLVVVFLCLILILLPTIKIVAPKLVLAMSGQKLNLHQVITEHNKHKMPSKKENVHVTGTSLNNPLSSSSSCIHRDIPRTAGPSSVASEECWLEAVDETGESSNLHKDEPVDEIVESNNCHKDEPDFVAENAASSSSKSTITQSAENDFRKCLDTRVSTETRGLTTDTLEYMNREEKKLIVRDGDAPPGELIKRMLDLRKKLNKVTDKIGYGISVSPSDWESVNLLTEELGSSLSRIKFEDETNKV
jgi:hypothetical protein